MYVLQIVFIFMCVNCRSLSAKTETASRPTEANDNSNVTNNGDNSSTKIPDDFEVSVNYTTVASTVATLVNNATSDASNDNSTTNSSVSEDSHIKTWKSFLHLNQGALQRTFYVLIGVSALIIVYFVIRAIR